MTVDALDIFDDEDEEDLGDDSTYVDEIAVERRCAGDRTVTLNRTEAAEAVRRLEGKGLSASDIGNRLGITSRSVVRWRAGVTTPISLRGVTMTTPAPSPLARLLEDASGHGNARVRRLAARIESLFDDLRDLIAASGEQEKARQEVARLERQLAEAKAPKGGKPAVVASSDPRPERTEGIARNRDPLPCRKGCGKVSAGAQGRAGHERFCDGTAA